MEFVVIPSCKDDIFKYKKAGINTFIVGFKDLSTGYNVNLTLDEIRELSDSVNLFIAINKMIGNNELALLEDDLVLLDKMKIKGILYYDLSVLSIKKRLKLDIDLVWNQTHMVTNYNTCNFYYNEGVKYGYLANEITLDEMIEIMNKSRMSFLVNIISHPVMAHSKRKLLTNYFKANNIKKEKDSYLLKEKGNVNYIILEDDSGTTIRYGNIINGTKAIKSLIENSISYLVIDASYIDSNIIFKSLELLFLLKNNLDTPRYQELLGKLEKILGADTGFFYKKTIYKVKRGE